MKKILCLILSVILSAGLVACSGNSSEMSNTHDYMAMDTVFSIRCGKFTPKDGGEKTIDELFASCEKLTNDLDALLSVTKEGSDVKEFNSEIDVFLDADETLISVLNSALEIAEMTDGAYDPTVGPLTTLWNVKGGGPIPEDGLISDAMSHVGYSKIEINEGSIRKSDKSTAIDLGGIGKGFAAQKLTEKLYESGASFGIVSAGRTVGVFGKKPDSAPFKIGIADPFNIDGVVGYIYTENGFVSVAGDYEQFFEIDGVRYHHIIDPSTGRPSDSGLTSVAVLSQNGAVADALSTALMVMGYEDSMDFYKSEKLPFEAVFIFSDGTIKHTDGLTEDRFSLSETYVGNELIGDSADTSELQTSSK